MLILIKSTLGRWSPTAVTAIGLAQVALIGYLDHLTGYELTLSVFYLLPIAMTAWYANSVASALVSVISALVWLFVDYASGHVYSHPVLPVWNAIAGLAFFLTTAFLLSRLKTQLSHVESLARTDGLTKVYNARAFKEVAARLIDVARRHRHPAVLGYIDLDNFKAVNDTLGHTTGDTLLQTVASTLMRCVRTSDVVGRLGGDEFAVFMPEIGQADARHTFARIHEELARDMAHHGWPVGISIGVAVFPESPPVIDEAIRIADVLMYRVKKSGKHNVLYEPLSATVASFKPSDRSG